jgi:hypothetical protein
VRTAIPNSPIRGSVDAQGTACNIARDSARTKSEHGSVTMTGSKKSHPAFAGMPHWTSLSTAGSAGAICSGGALPRRHSPASKAESGSSRAARRARPSGRSPKSCLAILLDGELTSVSVKLRRYYVNLTSGPGGGCVPSLGGNGRAGTHALPSCDAAASAGIWRHKLPAAHMALGASATVPRSRLPCRTHFCARSD